LHRSSRRFLAGLSACAPPSDFKFSETEPDAAAEEQEAFEADARAFRAALVSGESSAMRNRYSPTVLLGGSELWKPKWGMLAEGEKPPEDRRVGRDELLAAYDRLIGAVGSSEWSGTLGAWVWSLREVGPDSPGNGYFFSVLKVPDGTPYLHIDAVVGDDYVAYFFERSEDGTWRVFAELSGY
jgi:predicted secreted protein